MANAQTGEVVWYVTGRFYSIPATATTDAQLVDVGYFLNIQGLPPLFSGTISESAALLTFAAQPFTSASVQNGGLNIGLDMTGSFSIYLLDGGGATFDDPSTFSPNTPIATFQRVSIVPTLNIAASTTENVLMNVFSAQLVSSTPFTFAGEEYDFADLVGYGVTQWGTAATQPLTPPSGYTSVVPFVGSAIRVG